MTTLGVSINKIISTFLHVPLIPGVILSREGSGVWAHNRSAVPIFVNSPTLDVPNSRTFSVFRIPPGFSMQIFSWDLAAVYAGLRDPACYDGPFDPHSVRLSLGKGWGAGYGRQYVECCPCWLEVMLLPGRWGPAANTHTEITLLQHGRLSRVLATTASQYKTRTKKYGQWSSEKKKCKSMTFMWCHNIVPAHIWMGLQSKFVFVIQWQVFLKNYRGCVIFGWGNLEN